MLFTGLPTIWHHSIEASHLATFCDVATNILLVWAIQLAVAFDFMQGKSRKNLIIATSIFNGIVWIWLFAEMVLASDFNLITFGSFGHFQPGEVALILNAWGVVGLFVLHLKRIPKPARPALLATFLIFFCGMVLATAKGSQISAYIFPLARGLAYCRDVRSADPVAFQPHPLCPGPSDGGRPTSEKRSLKPLAGYFIARRSRSQTFLPRRH